MALEANLSRKVLAQMAVLIEGTFAQIRRTKPEPALISQVEDVTTSLKHRDDKRNGQTKCRNCGFIYEDAEGRCPARSKKCYNCDKVGHFGRFVGREMKALSGKSR